MVHGVVGIIACPMVDDNLVYSLNKNKDEKNILIIDNEHNGSLRRKLDAVNIQYSIIDKRDILMRRYEMPQDRFTLLIEMIDLGLHSRPELLKQRVEDIVLDMQPFVDCFGFYIATCGNYDWNIPKWCEEKRFKPGVMFTDENGCLCHDCVGINISGGPKYLELQKKYPGHLYIFPAMATNYDDFMEADQAESNAVQACITDDMREVLGIEPGKDGYMRWLLAQGNYEYILKIDTGLGDREGFERELVNISERTRLKIKIPEDREWADLGPTDMIYSKCKALLHQD